ncbi:class I SAM-dependent methyltransferase [Allorhizobium sp. BGMRC 0089]|uniref:class I SAM-dependent methyltransferase n=1 Tax=Allorhizobium sonneratiae TaxID=2934936 RepID=UPI0020335387|nr:class I SAM-dependent methyltransferase [Allorhizobium sonneratiae]MCM2294194.1 class I SAM-dependent methyltransferase [Allorhizobium sonneratiae]
MSALPAGDGLDRHHASKMDQVYRYQRHIYDLTRKYYLLGRDRAIAGLNVPEGGSLLEVACGTGRNLVAAARHYPASELHGFDISSEMLTQARRNFRVLSHPPSLRVADATTFRAEDFGLDGFDRVLISYALSMIPDWEKAIEASLAALKSGGELHIVDFGHQARLPETFRRLLHVWLARFHVTPRETLQDILQEQADKAGARLRFTSLYRDYAWHAVIRLA